MKKRLAVFAAIVTVATAAFAGYSYHTHEGETTIGGATQHSGGTDAYGCHTNSQTGVYHCH